VKLNHQPNVRNANVERARAALHHPGASSPFVRLQIGTPNQILILPQHRERERAVGLILRQIWCT